MGSKHLMRHRDEIKDSNLAFADIIFPCQGVITCCQAEEAPAMEIV